MWKNNQSSSVDGFAPHETKVSDLSGNVGQTNTEGKYNTYLILPEIAIKTNDISSWRNDSQPSRW
jgi:hypothetical protein